MQIINKLTTIGAILVLIVVFSCNSEKKEQNTVINATIEGANGMEVYITNMDPFNPTSDTLKIDENGIVNHNLDIKTPQYYTLGLGRTHLVVFVRPGDSLLFSTNINNVFGTIKYSGVDAIYNDYIIGVNKVSGAFQSKLFDVFSKEEETVTVSLDSLRALHADDLAALQMNNSDLDPYFLEIEKARILYEWALLHRIYPDYYQYINKDKELQISPEFDTYLAETSLNDESLIELPIYTKFIEAYLRNGFSKYETQEVKDKYSSHVTYELSVIDNEIENSKIKSIMAYNTISQQVKYDGIKDYDLYWDDFKRICNNDFFISKIKESLKDWEYLKKGMPAKDFSFVNINGENVKLSDFKGKWVYIDIWATWCNPCVGEIPKLKELEEKYRDDNIVFMSISVDRTQEPWKAMVVENEMKGIQLWAGQNDLIKDFYRVNGIPRFMIIDPETNIYEVSADRPSMGVETTLDKLLAK